MAKIQADSSILGIRGTIDGATFAENPTGAWVRSWSRSPTRQTPGRMRVRADASRNNAAWFGLTSSEQDAWDAFAADPAQEQTGPFGETFFLTGRKWYGRVNRWLLDVDRSPSSVPPTSSQPAAPTILDFRVDLSDVRLVWLDYPSGHYTGFDLVVFVGMRASPQSVTQVAHPLLVLGDQSPGIDVTLFAPQFEDAFGLVEAGRRFVASVYKQSTDGYRSGVTEISTLSV